MRVFLATTAIFLYIVLGIIVLYQQFQNKRELRLTPWENKISWIVYAGLILSLICNLIYAVNWR